MKNNKLFILQIQSSWSLGDQCGDNTFTLGVFDDPEKARTTGLEHLSRNYHYDEQTGSYYGDCWADDVWFEIFLFELNKPLDDERYRNICEKKDDGKWYVGEEVVYG